MKPYSEYGIVKLTLTVCGAVAVLCIGILGLGGSGGLPDVRT
jgi:hypothetical protein